MEKHQTETELIKISKDLLRLAENIAIMQTNIALICESLENAITTAE